MELDEVAEAEPQVIQGVRPLRMSGNLHALPGVEVGKNLPLGLLDMRGDAANLGVEVDLMTAQMALQIVQFLRQFNDRLFEVQGGDVHLVGAGE